MIGVSAVGPEREWCDFSQYNESVFIAAPGDLMVTAEKSAADAYRSDRDGTSFSSPCIAAIAALALQADDTLTPKEFSELLKDTAEDLGDAGYDIYYGYGMADIEALLKTLDVSLNEITAKEKASQTVVSGFVEGMQPLEEKKLVIAGYQADGQMITVVIPEECQADKIGVLDIRGTLERELDSFSEIKLFWLMPDADVPVPEKKSEYIVMQ